MQPAKAVALNSAAHISLIRGHFKNPTAQVVHQIKISLGGTQASV